MGIPIRKMTEKFARNPVKPADEDFYKICYFMAEGKIRVDYHREEGKLTFKSVTYVQEGDKIRGSRSMSAKRDLNTFGREDVLEPSVYDTARESAKADALRGGAEEEKPEEQTSKVDILAPYLVDLVKSGTMQLDSVQATLVAKKCTQDFRKRLADRAEIIQRRLEEEQDLLRKRRAQMQRRGDNIEKDEKDFERYQSQAMFRTQILEQRLARHEMQAFDKFQELERTLQEDPRLAAMWQKESSVSEARLQARGS